MQTINIYCDESCHLPNDGEAQMILGAIVCPKEHVRDVAISLREVRMRHGLSTHLEIKWGGISPSKIDFFLDVIDVFLQDSLLKYRAVVANKERLNHEHFNQTHDDWYHKMYFQLLRHFISSNAAERFRIYLDIKDTNSATKLRTLHDVLCNGVYDFNHEVLENVQALPSHEVALIQLTDLLTGAVSYAARGLQTSPAKLQVVERLQEALGRPINRTTWLSERKFNVFVWEPQQ